MSDRGDVSKDHARSSGTQYADELVAFAAELAALRIAQGKPSLLEIERHAPASRPLSKSAVSEALAGKRLPGLDFLITLVQTLLMLGDPRRHPVPGHDPRLSGWRSRWERLQLLHAQERRSQPAVADASGDSWAPSPVTPSMATGRDLRCFVAMPGSSMGGSAGWTDILEIRRRLLKPVADRIRDQLACGVELVIEKEKSATGAIHRSMFAEALEADIYIADLTGANPNVYLELGARWALSDGVTILICQDITDVRFNAVANRVIEYSPMPDSLEDAVHRIAQAAVAGLNDPLRSDSPVRDGSPTILVSRAKYEALAEEISRLREQQAAELLEAAHRTADPHRKVELLEEAVARNPASWQAHFELGTVFRRNGRSNEAEEILTIAVQLKPDFAPAWRELGITLGQRQGAESAAVAAFGRALALDDQDSETWATQGGLLRRLSRRPSPGGFDTTMLERALICYRKASEITPNQLYPLMNAARIELLLAGIRKADTESYLAKFSDLEHLARYAVSSGTGGEPWALFDLADALLLTGHAAKGLAELRQAAALCATEERATILAAVAEPLRDFLTIEDALPPGTADVVRQALDACKELSRQAQAV